MLRDPETDEYRMSSVRIAATVICILAGVSFGYWMSKTQSEPEVQTAMLYPAPQPLPDVALASTDGTTAGPEFFENQWSLVFFGFTECPDVCPATLTILAAARKKLEQADVEALPRIVLVSVDPERDTVDRLRAYTGGFGEGIVGLTGSLDDIRTFTNELNIFFQKVDVEGGGYTVDHSSVVMVVNPDGQLIGLFSAPHKADTIARDFRVLLQR